MEKTSDVVLQHPDHPGVEIVKSRRAAAAYLRRQWAPVDAAQVNEPAATDSPAAAAVDEATPSLEDANNSPSKED